MSDNVDSSARKLIRRGGIANFCASGITAIQSIVMLMVISHTSSLAAAGIFSFGFANANLLINLGRFGMRNYQASDVRGRFSFSTYWTSRLFTVSMMIIACVLYLATFGVFLDYGFEKLLAILLLAIFKAEDAYEDVYHGAYQQNGRLDIAGMNLSIRLLAGLAIFVATMLMGCSLNESLVIQIIFGSVYIFFETRYVKRRYGIPCSKPNPVNKVIDRHPSSCRTLLAECVPLFVMAFASFFIVNAPKYVIDALCGDEDQAIFGYLFMPVFVINLFANAIFQPQVSVLARYRSEQKNKKICTALRRQMVYTAVITTCCAVLAGTFGIPVLELMYKVDLSDFRPWLIVLMLGGGFYAASVILMIGITIMRAQGGMGVRFAFLSIFSLVLSAMLVWIVGGISGACISYVLAMIVQCVILLNVVLPVLRCDERGAN